MRLLSCLAWLPGLLVMATPALAEAEGGDEKLPAQLPTVTIQGKDLSQQEGDANLRIAPQLGQWNSRVTIPETPQRRATAEDNRTLMVGVTPTTVEPPTPLPTAQMPYTSVMGGWGPLLQYRAGVYDARWWGPAMGVTEIEGRAGWGWSGWQAREWLDWPGVARAGGNGEGFFWQAGGKEGRQNAYGLTLDLGPKRPWGASLRYERGAAEGASQSLYTQRAAAVANWRPQLGGKDHRSELDLTLQHRIWGKQDGAEGYVRFSDVWTLSDHLELEGALGGGYWGREPILDPSVLFHLRPSVLTHLFVGLKARSELPDFEALYLRRPATAANDDLQAERVQGWAQLGGSHRLTDQVWAHISGDLRQSKRLIFWSDKDGDGLWQPANNADDQWTQVLDGRLQINWLPGLQQNIKALVRSTQPLGFSELRLATNAEGSLPGPAAPIAYSVSLDHRQAQLSTEQIQGGGLANGLFAEADLRYPLSQDLHLGLRIADVPLILNQPSAPNYFAPTPLLTGHVQYLF
ncbi:MAG: hypothetical protein VKP62_01400 [Candidatus Sericytochromatia bacterium]|nr:hypothetical protein [Candidatus Sericytochromatia bacterium]